MIPFWTISNRYPPILCRLLARHPNSKPLTAEEIAARGRLSITEVNLISHQTDWAQVTLTSMRAFLNGCGIDFCKRADMHRVDSYIRAQPTWKYLRTSGLWTSLYEPMLKKYAASLKLRT